MIFYVLFELPSANPRILGQKRKEWLRLGHVDHLVRLEKWAAG